MKIFLFFIFSINLLLIYSCKKYKPANPAFFIKAGNISVKTTSLQGSGSNKITDLWLYVNGKFEGAYPIGNLMPIPNPSNETVKINVFAGIKNNGITNTRIPWNLYSPIELDTLVENGRTIGRSFTFEYRSAVLFPWIEDFEQPGFKLINSPNSSSKFTIASSSDSYEGRSLKLEIISTYSTDVAQIESSDYYAVPTGDGDLYLEVDYKTNAPVSIGVVGDSDPTQKPAVVLNPTDSWNKIYVQLATVVSSEPISSRYKIYFQLLKTADYPNPKLFLDNLKLAYIP